MVLQLRVSAAVAPYIDAIKEKRAAGWRWADIRKALNVDCTDRGFGQAVRRCRWKAEQLPLPELEKTKTIAHTKPADVKAGNTESRPVQTLEIPKKQDVLTGKEVINHSSNFKML